MARSPAGGPGQVGGAAGDRWEGQGAWAVTRAWAALAGLGVDDALTSPSGSSVGRWLPCLLSPDPSLIPAPPA